MKSSFIIFEINAMKTSFVLFVAVLLVLAGCGKKQPTPEVKTFDLKGVVVSVDPPAHRITIDHEEIPNYMMAMAMPFRVKDTTLLLKVQPGDTVQGVLAVSRTESWIESIAVTSKGEKPETAAEAEHMVMKKMFRIGDPLPDFSVVNQNGRRIRLSDFRGKVVALTFVYTRCPLPDFCIRMSNNFSAVQKDFSKNPSLKNSWHLITVSFDPTYDTPAVLRKYGAVYTKDVSTWDFATDSMKSVMEIGDGLELDAQPDEGGLIAHNLRTAIIDQQGNLVAVYKGNEWTTAELEETMMKTIREHK